MRPLFAFLWLLGSGSGLAAAPADVPLPRPRPSALPAWIEPRSFREAAGPDFNTADVTARPSACDARLATLAQVERMPRLIGPDACGGEDMVRLDAVLLPGDKRIEVRPASYLRCPMAEQLAVWVHNEAASRLAMLGAALTAVDIYDDFSCRGRNRQTGGKLSEHGKGNAVDVRGFTLADGRFIALTDVNAPKDLREALRDSACARFATVLGPGSDSHHEAHIHLDMLDRRNGYRICQWEVREPPPTVAGINGESVPLPPRRPSIPDDRSRRMRRL